MFFNKKRFFKELTKYDFKNEAPWDLTGKGRTSIDRFNSYRRYNKDKKMANFDCDNSNGTCPLADSIYMALWGWSYKNRFTLPDLLKKDFELIWDRFGPDTMNSFATTYRQALKIYGNDKNKAYGSHYLQELASLTHYIGNFTLFPFKLNPKEDKKSFNQYRGFNSGKYFVYDYFDLSLKILKENVDDLIFRKYIDTFYLNDYVDENYNIKPLLKSHEALLNCEKMPTNNPDQFLPQTESELNEYLKNVISKIKARGKRIASELEEKNSEILVPKRVNKSIAFAGRLSKVFNKFNSGKKFNRILKIFTSAVFINYFIKFAGILFIERQVPMAELIKTYGVIKISGIFLMAGLPESLESFVWHSMTMSFVIWLIRRKLWFCKQCGKVFVLKKTKTVLIKNKEISKRVILKKWDANGDIVGTEEQYIPGSRLYYRTDYKCKNCGANKEVFFSKRKLNV